MFIQKFHCLCSDLCKKAEEVKERFVRLAETQFVRRCPEIVNETVAVTGSAAVPEIEHAVPIFKEYRDPFLLPDAINMKAVGDGIVNGQ